MSFSYDVKEELCREPSNTKLTAIAECYGILLYCNTFTDKSIKIITGSTGFAAALPKLFSKAFGVKFDDIPEDGGSKRKFCISDPEQIRKVTDALGYEVRTAISHQINLGVLEEDKTREAFVKGAFLAGGSVTDPRKRYHLEFVTDHFKVSKQMYTLLLEMGLEPRNTSRKGNHITYFKQSETIADLLTTIGAPISAMEIMSAKIEKGMTNSVNRKVNCDTANVAKTVEAAAAQIEAIRIIESRGGLDRLPEKLRETALFRIENPELSISELAEILPTPVTKSCLNHRLRKLMQISKEAEE